MPTYIYRCQTCEEEYEIVQSFKDDPIEKCPSDCSGTVKKVFSGVGISFKGSGFYKNDHGSNSKKKPQESNSKETSKDTKDTKDTKYIDFSEEYVFLYIKPCIMNHFIQYIKFFVILFYVLQG